MKLGKETGSLVNHIHSIATRGQPEPVVGMPATILLYSDRRPATVVEVFKIGGDLAVTVQEDFATRIDDNGMSESQEYTYGPNPDGPRETFRFRGERWRQTYKNPETGRWVLANGNGLRLGVREKYYDFTR